MTSIISDNDRDCAPPRRRHAEILAGKGFRVFPLVPNRKMPRIKEWPRRATTNLLQVRLWWRQWPDANIGIACGGGLVVIDVDPRHGGEVDPAWPKTATVETPSGGRHLYYRCDAEIRNSAGELARGVDVRGEGGYVVAPGSCTDAGAYEWLPLPPNGIAVAPPTMFAGTGHGSGNENSRGVGSSRNNERRFALREHVGEGERNGYLASYAGWLLANGYEPDEVEDALLDENRGVCVPVLDDEEVLRVAASITRTHQAREARR